ncbi:MAG: serine hydrolase domain-containing protein [Candidatus Hodarchaeales archaeon]
MAESEDNKYELTSELTIAIKKTHPTPSAKKIVNYLYAFNSGDYKAILNFYENQIDKVVYVDFLPEKLANQDYLLYQSTHGLRADRVVSISDWSISIIAQAMLSELWFSIDLTLSEDTNLVSKIDIIPIHTPKDMIPNNKLTSKQIIRHLNNYMQTLMYEDIFSGAILVAKDNEPIFKKAYGLASKQFNVDNKIDTKFNITSLNQMFTAVAIIQLVESGKIAFEDNIIQYIDDFPSEIANQITIHQLLTHTSGLPDYNAELLKKSWWNLRKVNDFIQLFKNEPLVFQPGDSFNFNYSGYDLLGFIIEKITKNSYYDYINENIFQPADMENTVFSELDEVVNNLANGYTNKNIDENVFLGPKKSNIHSISVKGSPACGAYSTIEDLFNFSVALKQNKLMSESYKNIILSEKVKTNAPGLLSGSYSYGFLIQEINNHQIIGHSGVIPGASASFDMYPEKNYTIIILSNYDEPGVKIVNQKVRNLICR